MEAKGKANPETVIEKYHYVECGLDNVWLENGFAIEEREDGRYLTVHRAHDLHRAIATALATKPSLLSGKEVRFLRKELDMSQRRLGELLGREAQTVAGWEKGDGAGADADYLIRHIYRQKLDGRSGYVDLVDELNRIDRDEHAKALRPNLVLEETSQGWQARAA